MTAALISLGVMIFAIYILSIVTDEFFIESLDQIAKAWKLPDNVAGASLMAMGSSAPELAIALFALFQSGGKHSDLGIGTIVGSAVFNILVITGVSAIARPAKVTWRVVLRDSVFYVMCIFLLLFAFSDGKIALFEALSFIGFYVFYIVVLFQWNRFFPTSAPSPIEQVEEHTEEVSQKSLLYRATTGLFAKAFRLLTGDPRKSYLRAFIMSILAIAGLSYFLVEHALIFSHAMGIPPVLVGLTILAAGTSIPDLLASVIVARQGRGDMAIANAIGSNIFDILIGLGLPWALAIVLRRYDLLPGSSIITVGTSGLWLSVLILLGTVFLLFILLSIGKKLSKREGIILLLCYVGYVAWIWLGGGV